MGLLSTLIQGEAHVLAPATMKAEGLMQVE